MSPARIITDDELLQLPKDGNKYEVVGGELVVSPGAGLRHEWIVAESGNKRGPDVSFIASDRVAALSLDTVFPELAPDLAVEVLSPSDSSQRVLDKVGEYIDAGVRMVWVVDPGKRQAAVYRTATDVRYVGLDGTIDGEDVLRRAIA